MSIETIVAGAALFISGGTAFALLTLLDGNPLRYASKKDLEEVRDKVDLVGRNQVMTWRYVEAVDDRLDLAGLPVLRASVPEDKATADW